MSSFLDTLKERIVVFDGAMGTNLQVQNLSLEDFGGLRFEGCNENLLVTRPDAVENVHVAFLDVGCDVVETNSFNGTPVDFAEYDIGDKAYDMNVLAARLAKRVAADKVPASNLVFLIDVSGSMMEPNKLPLVKQSINVLIDHLREEDRVALVVYAGAAGVVLPSTPGSEKEVIRQAVFRLQAGGSTAGGAGIRLAYDIAKQNFIKGGNNRVILATDGDFNVGESDDGALTRLVEQRREEGTFLTVLGYGYYNLNDQMMEQLADKGNGNYAYIDDLLEAKKMFGTELTSTIYTVAKDVKLQVEFNPAAVQAYRLIGYEDRKLANEDFTNDKKDAGDMGAGHSVTALYEIIPVGVKPDVEIGTVGRLRYQRVGDVPRAGRRDELMYVNVRYKLPDGRTSRLLQQPVRNEISATDADFSFALAVASYGMLLRESPFRGASSFESVLSLARDGIARDVDGYRAEFTKLVDATRALEAFRVGSGPRER